MADCLIDWMSHYGASWSDRFDSSKPCAAIVHRNTVYLDRAVRRLRTQGADVPADLLPHVAPLGWEHIALTVDLCGPAPMAPNSDG